MQKAEWFALSLVFALAVHGALLPADSSRSTADAGVEGGLVMPGWPFARTSSESLCRSASDEPPEGPTWRARVHDTVELLGEADSACTEAADALVSCEPAAAGPRLSMVLAPLALTR